MMEDESMQGVEPDSSLKSSSGEPQGRWLHDLFGKEGDELGRLLRRRTSLDGSGKELFSMPRVVIENLHWKMSEKLIEDMMRPFAPLKVILRFDLSGRSTGIAEVFFRSYTDAERARTELNGKEIESRKIVVHESEVANTELQISAQNKTISTPHDLVVRGSFRGLGSRITKLTSFKGLSDNESLTNSFEPNTKEQNDVRHVPRYENTGEFWPRSNGDIRSTIRNRGAGFSSRFNRPQRNSFQFHGQRNVNSRDFRSRRRSVSPRRDHFRDNLGSHGARHDREQRLVTNLDMEMDEYMMSRKRNNSRSRD